MSDHEHAVFIPAACAYARVGVAGEAGRAIVFGTTAEDVNGLLVDVLRQSLKNGSLRLRTVAECREWSRSVLSNPTEADAALVDDTLHMVSRGGGAA